MYLALTETELALASSRPASLPRSTASCRSAISRPSHAFFRFDWDEVAFVLSRYPPINLHRSCAVGGRGMRTSIFVPTRRADLILSDPPTEIARSRIPSRPT